MSAQQQMEELAKTLTNIYSHNEKIDALKTIKTAIVANNEAVKASILNSDDVAASEANHEIKAIVSDDNFSLIKKHLKLKNLPDITKGKAAALEKIASIFSEFDMRVLQKLELAWAEELELRVAEKMATWEVEQLAIHKQHGNENFDKLKEAFRQYILVCIKGYISEEQEQKLLTIVDEVDGHIRQELEQRGWGYCLKVAEAEYQRLIKEKALEMGFQLIV